MSCDVEMRDAAAAAAAAAYRQATCAAREV